MGAHAVARDVAGGVGGVEQELRGQPMNDRLEAISRLIAAVARQENQELRPLGRGIAFVPELAFAYLVGKAVTAQSSDIFGTPDVRWSTDELIAGFGRASLVFHPAAPGKAVVVEFKRKFGPNLSYLAHLNRFGSIDEHKYDRLFCGLMFSGVMKPIVEPLNDPRIRAVEAASNLRVRPAYSPFEYFEKWPKLVTPVVVGVWQLLGRARAEDAT
jgi:hypothetical protein